MALDEREARGAAGLVVDFDSQEDVLYISLGAPVPSYADEAPDGVLLRRAETTGRPSGVTAFDFLKNWQGRRSAFYVLVAQYLRLPVALVRRGIRSAI